MKYACFFRVADLLRGGFQGNTAVVSFCPGWLHLLGWVLGFFWHRCPLARLVRLEIDGFHWFRLAYSIYQGRLSYQKDTNVGVCF